MLREVKNGWIERRLLRSVFVLAGEPVATVRPREQATRPVALAERDGRTYWAFEDRI